MSDCTRPVVRFDTEVGGDVVADHFEPAELFVGERLFAARGRSYKPGVEVGIDAFGERDEFVVLVDGEAHERHEVGEDASAAGAFDSGFFQRGVRVP